MLDINSLFLREAEAKEYEDEFEYEYSDEDEEDSEKFEDEEEEYEEEENDVLHQLAHFVSEEFEDGAGGLSFRGKLE